MNSEQMAQACLVSVPGGDLCNLYQHTISLQYFYVTKGSSEKRWGLEDVSSPYELICSPVPEDQKCPNEQLLWR